MPLPLVFMQSVRGRKSRTLCSCKPKAGKSTAAAKDKFHSAEFQAIPIILFCCKECSLFAQKKAARKHLRAAFSFDLNFRL